MISTSNLFRYRTLGAIILLATLAPLCFSQNQQKIVVAPRPISVVTPSYPKEARKKKIEGSVVLHAVVTLDGTLQGINVVSGNPILADVALEAVRQWRYQPSKINGEPVEAQREIVITFKRDKNGEGVYLGADDLSPDVPLEPPPDIATRLAAEEFFSGGGRDVTHPQLTYNLDPEYSETARRAKYQCSNVLSLIVGADGLPLSVWVVKPCGEGLDEKSIEAVQQWKFRPATKDGEPVPVFINVETSFHLY
jgi:TonB family protein